MPLPTKYRGGLGKRRRRRKTPFDLPRWNVRLAASDEQKLLFVSGGDAQQIAQVQALVSLLDQPLRHVEIEAQFVQLPASELKQFRHRHRYSHGGRVRRGCTNRRRDFRRFRARQFSSAAR